MTISIKRTLASLSVCAALVAPTALAADLTTDAQKESYSVGASFAKYLLGQLASQEELGVTADLNAVTEGFADTLANESELSNDEIIALINARAETLNAKVSERKAELDAANAKAAEEFLATNAAKEGVTVTESGLQYEVLVAGEGEKPAPEDVVTVNFKGMLMDGTVFEDTFAQNDGKGAPTKVSLVNSIEGWSEGLQLMTIGSTYRFTLPAELAYGDEAMGAIPSKSALVFEIELIEKSKPDMGHGMGGMGMGGMGGMNGHP